MTKATVRSTAQSMRLHAILGKLGIDSDTKADMVHEATGGRATSSKDLYEHECDDLIRALQVKLNQVKKAGNNSVQSWSPKPGQKMRRTILSVCHQLGWEDASGEVDLKRVDMFLLERGVVKKRLTELSRAELPKVVTQFNQMLIRQFKR